MEINVLIDEDLDICLESSWLRSIAEQALRAQHANSDVEMGLVITTQQIVQQLNQSYRGRDELTDVLAFLSTEKTGAEALPFVNPPDGVKRLGEVIISYPQAVKQAREQQHSIKREIAILIIHGVLHLLGYDHEEDGMEREISIREEEILNLIEGVG